MALRAFLPTFEKLKNASAWIGVSIGIAIGIGLVLYAVFTRERDLMFSPGSGDWNSYISVIYVMSGVLVLMIAAYVALQLIYTRAEHASLERHPQRLSSRGSDQRLLISQARTLITQARERGYSEAEIFQRFKTEGWSDAQIKKFLIP